MTKQNHMKHAIYVNGFVVWLEEISDFLLKYIYIYTHTHQQQQMVP